MSIRECVALILVAQTATAQSAAPKAIPDEPLCARCTITTRTLVMLGTDDGVGSLNGKPMSVNIDSRGRYWVFQELEPPTVFSTDGRMPQRAGRKGSGPGEFRSANNSLVVGDSMLVFDWLESRATMMGPDLKSGRTICIRQGMGDLVVVDWPSSIVTMGWMSTSNPPNSTMHRLSLSGPEVRVLGSFGPRGTGGSMGNAEVNQRIGWARDGVWSSYWNRPQFTRWDRNGVARDVFTRRFDWYTGETPASIGDPNTPPTPRTALVIEDSSGLVWYFIHRPAATWKDGWAGARPFQVGAGSEFRSRDLAYDRLFNTYVEVIDPVQARVVARHTINGFVFEALPGRKVAQYMVDFSGVPKVQIVQLTLNGR